MCSTKKSGRRIHCNGNLPIIRANENQVAVVCQKLFSNAMKYTTEDSTPDIQIPVERKDLESIFAVSDKKIGLAPECTRLASEPLKHMRGSTPPKGPIGMAHFTQILKQYSSRNWAGCAGEGQGARFCFALSADQRQ